MSYSWDVDKQMTDQDVREFLIVKKEAAQHIDPVTAEMD
jgi:hypothetical protein